VVRFWDTRTGKQVRELALPQPKERGSIGGPFLDIAPGAGRVAVRGYGPPYGHVDVLDATDGSLVRRLLGEGLSEGRFSRDGKVLVLSHQASTLIGAWEVDTGKKLLAVEAWNLGDVGRHLLFPDPADNAGGMKFSGFPSPDNRLVVTDALPRALKHGENEFLFVWRLGVGASAPAARVPAPGAVWLTAVVPSPDGRSLVVCTHTRFGVYDLIREEYRPEFKAPAQKWAHAALCPDGKTLAVIAQSTAKRTDGGTRSVYLARFPKLGPVLPAGGEWAAADVDFLWAGVSSRNEFRRAYCTRALSARPERAAAIARERLRPVPRAEVARVEGLIQKLNDDSPDVRDKATAELRDCVYTFGPLLQVAHREAPVGEVRNRLGNILDPARRPPAPAGLEAALRQVEFLERMGAPEARKLLVEVAAGAPAARLTEAAAAALGRLTKP
jgi:hypothetical protein